MQRKETPCPPPPNRCSSASTKSKPYTAAGCNSCPSLKPRSSMAAAAQIMTELDKFYAAEYMAYTNAVADGLPVSLRTEGEYSVLSEDALFDAFDDHYRLAWQWLREATAALDPENRA